MSRGLSQQQRILLAALQESIDLHRTTGHGARAMTTYQLIELTFACDLYESRTSWRPYVLRSGVMTPSMFRSWQRALQGLVRRGLVVRLPNTWRADHCLIYTTPDVLTETGFDIDNKPLSIRKTAQVLGVSESTIRRDHIATRQGGR
jgi:hypothetical protein